MTNYLKKMSSVLFLTLCLTCSWHSFFSSIFHPDSIPFINLPGISALGDGISGNPPLEQH